MSFGEPTHLYYVGGKKDLQCQGLAIILNTPNRWLDVHYPRPLLALWLVVFATNTFKVILLEANNSGESVRENV